MQLVAANKIGIQESLTFQLSLEELDSIIKQKLSQWQNKSRIKGFRPGKTPKAILVQYYEQDIIQTVVQDVIDLLNKQYSQYLEQAKIEVTIFDRIQFNLHTVQPSILEFTLSFEHIPQIDLEKILHFSLIKPHLEVESKQVKDFLDKCQAKAVKYSLQNNKIPIENNDIVVLDILGTTRTGKVIKKSDVRVKAIDSKQMQTKEVNRFDYQVGIILLNQIVEAVISIEKSKIFKELFQNHYDIIGDSLQLKIVAIYKPITMEINDELARFYQLENLESLERVAHTKISQDNQELASFYMQQMLLDLIDKTITFEIPHKLIAEEMQCLKNQNANASKSELLQAAHSRVKLSLVVAEFANKYQISVTPADIENIINASKNHVSSEEHQALIQRISKDRNYRDYLSTVILRDKVLNWIISQVHIDTKPMTLDQVQQQLLLYQT